MLAIIEYVKTFFSSKKCVNTDMKDEKPLQLYEHGHEGSAIDYTIVKDPIIVDNGKLYNFIIVDDEPMVKMLLDLTIEYRIRLGNGQVYSLDGIDIYSKLLKHNPDIKVRFFTAHTIGKNPESNIKSEMMTSDKYIVKYKNLTGLDLIDVSIPKLHVEDAPDSIIKLLKSFLDLLVIIYTITVNIVRL